MRLLYKKVSLELQNNIYKSITNNEEDLFEIYNHEDFNYKNINDQSNMGRYSSEILHNNERL